MKKLLCYLGLAFVFITACSKELQVTVAIDVTVEYGEEIDNSVLFDAENSDENVSVKTVEDFDATKLGEQTLKVTFTDGEKEVEKEVIITVEDTQNPEITLDKEEITITVGDEITLKDNVKEVTDPVDGALEYSDEEVETNGYYIDKGELDTTKAGAYEVRVIAKDKNGNETKKTFHVIVKEKSTAKTEISSSNSNTTSSSTSKGQSSSSSNKSSSSSTSESSGSSSSSNKSNSSSGTSTSQGSSSSSQQSSSGNSSSNTASNNSQSSSQTCTVKSSSLGNTGKLFSTEAEAKAWAEENYDNIKIASYGYMDVYDTCGNYVGYTVHFTYIDNTSEMLP